MKLVIDIPEDMYNDANILIVKDLPELKKIILNGTPYDEFVKYNGISYLHKDNITKSDSHFTSISVGYDQFTAEEIEKEATNNE